MKNMILSIILSGFVIFGNVSNTHASSLSHSPHDLRIENVTQNAQWQTINFRMEEGRSGLNTEIYLIDSVTNNNKLQAKSFMYDASNIPDAFERWTQCTEMAGNVYWSMVAFAGKDHTLFWTVQSNDKNELSVWCTPREELPLRHNDPYLLHAGFMVQQYNVLMQSLFKHKTVTLKPNKTFQFASENSLNPNLEYWAVAILNALRSNG